MPRPDPRPDARSRFRCHAPGYGTHNIWTEHDVLYQAYYEGGLRVLDLSGDFQGNLASQGPEMPVLGRASGELSSAEPG